MKTVGLVLLCCLQALLLQAQSPQFSLKCALLGLEQDYDPVTLNEHLKESGAFFSYQEAAVVNGKYYLAWIDPNLPNAPSQQDDLGLLLTDLRGLPGLSFANPCIEAPNGEIAGLTNQIMFKLAPGKAFSDLPQPAANSGIEMAPHSHLKNWGIVTLPAHTRTSPIDAAGFFRRMNAVEEAEPNYLFQLKVATNDTYFDHQWNLDNQGYAIQGNGTPGADMSVPEAWALTTGDPSVIMAIIDSGVDTTHPDLVDNLLPGHDATGNGSQGFPNTNYPNDGHGTACAGIAGAKGDNNIGIAGVCYDCSIVPVKLFTYIFNPFGSPLPFATGDDMATAISWSWQDGNASLMSNSWGLTDNLLGALPGGTGVVNDALDMALDSARNGRGIPIFFSSGNDGDPPIWPGRRADLFSVNASSMCDERKNPNSCDGESWEGNWGDSLDVTAPGVRIPTTDMVGSNGYDGTDYIFGFNGTSAACPNAAGVMGLIMSMDSTLDLADYHSILESTCDKVGGYNYGTTLSNGTWSPEMGYGRINAFAAVQMANPVGIAELQLSKNSIQAFPNPATTHLEVFCQLPYSSEVQAELIDVSGRTVLVRQFKYQRGESYSLKLQWEPNLLQGGMYLLKTKTEKHILFNKILINN